MPRPNRDVSRAFPVVSLTFRQFGHIPAPSLCKCRSGTQVFFPNQNGKSSSFDNIL